MLASGVVPHIIWDWNGTLFDDLDIVVAAANDSLAVLGAAPIDADGYRDHYTRPVHLFYDGILGRPITDDEMAMANDEFFAGYRARIHTGQLAADAGRALDRVADSGGTQSVLSMASHHELVALVDGFGIGSYMSAVEGSIGPTGGTKLRLLERHLEMLSTGIGIRRDTVVVVGDSLDDANAATRAGVDAVLYDGGSHHRAMLDGAGVPVAGVPVAGSLVEAVDLAEA